MPFIRDQFTVLRLITLDGFTGDPDWVGTYDAAGARAAGNDTCVPTITGQVDLAFGYLDADLNLIAPEAASKVDFEVIALGANNPTASPLDAIYAYESVANLSVDELATLTRRLSGATMLAVRVFNLISTPITAIQMFVALRIG